MEYLDAYDEFKNYIGAFTREEVHEKGMWHNTIHCWLYDDAGNIYFQKRSDANKFYTTSSGHVKAGETLNVAFGREIKEEIGINVPYDKAELINIIPWQMDKEKNGKIIKDRAFANVYLLNIGSKKYHFTFNDGEVCGIAKLNAKKTLDLLNDKISSFIGTVITSNEEKETTITKEDFLVMPHETLIEKYGYILEAVINKRNN